MFFAGFMLASILSCFLIAGLVLIYLALLTTYNL